MEGSAYVSRFAATVFAVVVAAFAAAGTLLLVYVFGVNLPYWDEWVHLQVLLKFSAGELSAEDLFAQYNESRKVFPRLVIIALAPLTGGDQRGQMYLSVVIVAATVALVGVVARRTVPGSWAGLTAVAAVVLFSWAQWQNWLWGIQFVCFVPLACLMGVLALSGSAVRPWVRVAGSAGLCVLATFTYANGMLLWVLAAAALAVYRETRSVRYLTPLAALAAVCIGAYFAGYVRPAWTPTFGDSLSDPVRLAHYFVVLVGGAFSPKELGPSVGVHGVLLATALGTAVLGALAGGTWGAIRENRAVALPWLIVAAYSLISMAATSLGRSPFGVENAMLSRYATFSLPLVVAAVALLRVGGWPRAATAAGAVAAALTVAASVAVLAPVGTVSERQRAGRVMLHFCLTAPDATQTTLVADVAERRLIVPTAVRLSAAGLLSPPISPDGDLRPLLVAVPESPARFDAIVAAVPRADGALIVVRVFPATTGPDRFPPLPAGARLYRVRGDTLRAFPLTPR